MKVFACFVEKDEQIHGLRAIYEKESELVDITDFENGLSDATTTGIKHFLIKNDNVYVVSKTYFDLDNNRRILLAKNCTETFDILVSHAWGDWNMTKAPTETATGLAERICHSEDDHEETVVVAKLTDVSVWAVSKYIAETCTTTGSRTYTSIFGTITVEVPAKGHNYGDWSLTIEPTETTAGSAKRICKNDGTHFETTEVPVLTDTTVWTKSTYVPATCIRNGSQTYTSVYGTVTIAIPATGHNYGEYVMTKAPTETSTGIAVRTCKNDSSHTESITLPILTDTSLWTLSNTVNATCTESGVKTYTSKYGDVNVSIPATGHDYGNWSIITEPTLTSTGIAKRICKNNSAHVDEISIPKLSNESTWNILRATLPGCDADGSTTYTSVYGDVTVIEPAFGHDYSGWSITAEPTLTTTGVAKRTCKNDSSHIETVTLPILTDTSVWTIGSYVAPTCDASGSQVYNSIYGSITLKLNAIGHDYGNWSITTEPTLTSTGIAKRICKNNSNHVETITLPILTDTSVWTLSDENDATCETNGSQTYTSKYGDVDITLPSLGHDYGDWEEVTAPTTTTVGLKQKVCANDPSHIITEEIPMIEEEPPIDEGGDETVTE